jgi:hypothetical protein
MRWSIVDGLADLRQNRSGRLGGTNGLKSREFRDSLVVGIGWGHSPAPYDPLSCRSERIRERDLAQLTLQCSQRVR